MGIEGTGGRDCDGAFVSHGFHPAAHAPPPAAPPTSPCSTRSLPTAYTEPTPGGISTEAPLLYTHRVAFVDVVVSSGRDQLVLPRDASPGPPVAVADAHVDCDDSQFPVTS